MILKNPAELAPRLPRRLAFTLMEMLVVVAIIVVLAGIGGAYLMGQLIDSKVSAAKLQARVISQAIEMYAIDHNATLPTSLDVLLQRDPNGKGPYLKSSDALKDPYGNPFYPQYDPSGSAQWPALRREWRDHCGCFLHYPGWPRGGEL